MTGETRGWPAPTSRCFQMTDRPERAIEIYPKAIEIDRETGGRAEESTDTCRLGLLYLQSGMTAEALECYTGASTLFRSGVMPSEAAEKLLELREALIDAGVERTGLALPPGLSDRTG